MFCPNCLGELPREVLVCPDCHVNLVDELREPDPTPDAEMVKVFATANPALVAVAKSLLEEEAIEYFSTGEGLQALGFVSPGLFVEFMVRSEDADRAHGLLEGLAASTPDSGDDGDAA